MTVKVPFCTNFCLLWCNVLTQFCVTTVSWSMIAGISGHSNLTVFCNVWNPQKTQNTIIIVIVVVIIILFIIFKPNLGNSYRGFLFLKNNNNNQQTKFGQSISDEWNKYSLIIIIIVIVVVIIIVITWTMATMIKMRITTNIYGLKVTVKVRVEENWQFC